MQRDRRLGWVNWVYFGTASASLAFGIAAIVLASMLSVWGSDFPTAIEKDEFAIHTVQLQAALIQFYNVSIFLWAISFAFLASVNFKESSWITLCFGGLCFVALCVIWFKARRVAHAVRSAPPSASRGYLLPLSHFFFSPIRNAPLHLFVPVVLGSVLQLAWQFGRAMLVASLSPLGAGWYTMKALPESPLSPVIASCFRHILAAKQADAKEIESALGEQRNVKIAPATETNVV